MFEFYIGFSILLTALAFVAILICMVLWALDRDSAYMRPENVRISARRALFSLATPILAWLWPLTLPAAVLYLISRVVKDATLPTD